MELRHDSSSIAGRGISDFGWRISGDLRSGAKVWRLLVGFRESCAPPPKLTAVCKSPEGFRISDVGFRVICGQRRKFAAAGGVSGVLCSAAKTYGCLQITRGISDFGC